MSPRHPAHLDADDEPDDGPTDVSVTAVGLDGEGDPRLVDGRYRLVREIGRGGMSVVYLAEHVDLHRAVALKILTPPPSSSADVDFAEWFRREARTLAQIGHPNVVTLHDLGRLATGAYYLAMEWVDGPSLAELLREGPLDPHQAARLIVQVGQALRHTHQRGVVHRDVKPSNILVARGPDGEPLVKVIDFGIAHVTDGTATGEDVLVGSPHCMAPEQIEGEVGGPASDIYATGVVLFRAVTGKWPYHGSGRRETLVAHLVGTLPAMADAAPHLEVPPELEAIVRRCLARDASDRYPDMDALIRDLALFLHVDQELFASQSMVAPESTSMVTGALRRPERAPPPPPPEAAPPEATPAVERGRGVAWGKAVAGGAALLIALLVGATLFVGGSSEVAGEAAALVAEQPAVEAPSVATPRPAEAAPGRAEAEAPPPPEPAAAPEPPPEPPPKPVEARPTGAAEAPKPAREAPPRDPPAKPSKRPAGYKDVPDF